MGEVFVDVDADEAQAFLDKQRAALEAPKAALVSELARITARHAELKALLSARFGSSIQLEE